MTQSSGADAAKGYTLLILCGHPGSGKTTLAREYAASMTPPAKVLTFRPLIEQFLARLLGTDASNFREPRCNKTALSIDERSVNDDGIESRILVPMSYGNAYDDFYVCARMALPFSIWAQFLQREIETELRARDGTTHFVVDDMLQFDECEYFAEQSGARVVVLFLDGNPAGVKNADAHRQSFSFRKEVKELVGKTAGVYAINTNSVSVEKCIDFAKRCLTKPMVPEQPPTAVVAAAAATTTTNESSVK